MRAIQIKEYGGPEVLAYSEVVTPQPGNGEVLIKLQAIGVNFIDIYKRSGTYQNPLPLTLGEEGAGVVEKIGPGVTDFKPGDHVTYSNIFGSYAEYVVAPAARLVTLPEGLDFKSAAAVMLQGMTAHYLSHSTYPIQRGDSVLIHAGAGGVGLLLIQMAKMLGARVITTVSTEEKAALTREAGADEVILYTRVDFEEEVKRLTGGKGLPVVYDSVGKTTFDKSLNCLQPRGFLVLFGGSSGPVPPFNPLGLMKGSTFLTRPTLAHYVADRASLLERANAVLGWVASGKLKLRIEHTYPLSQAVQAHTDLAGRKTTGKLILLPEG